MYDVRTEGWIKKTPQMCGDRCGTLGAGSTYHCCSAVVVSLPAQAGSRFVCRAAGLEGPPASNSCQAG